MTAIEEFIDKIEQFELQKKQLVKSLKKDLKNVLKELFTTIPEIKTIYWTQYTPYFMDGDTCEFSMNEIIISNCDDEFVDYPDDIFGYFDEEETQRRWAATATSTGKYIKNAEHREIIKNFVKTIEKSEDLMAELFGNDVRVIGTKKGFRIEDYSDHH